MSRNGINLYLAHPWEMRKEIREWELYIEEKYNIVLQNPFYDIYRKDVIDLDRKKTRQEMKKFSKKQGEEIIERDLELIKKNDGLLAFVDFEQDSIGTPMEVFYSSKILKKPTYIITQTCRGHPWIIGLATEIFENKEEFENFIKNDNKLDRKA